jgi:hypothetical protein
MSEVNTTDEEVNDQQEESSSKATKRKVYDKPYRVTVNIHEDNTNKVLNLRCSSQFEARCMALVKMINELNYELMEFHVTKDPVPFYRSSKNGVINYKGEVVFECDDMDATKDILFIIESGLAKSDDEVKIMKEMEKLGWEI